MIRSNRGCRTRVGQRRALIFCSSLAVLGLAALFGPMFWMIGQPELERWWNHVILRSLTSPVPATPWALWSYVLGIAVLCWLFLASRFRHVEPPHNLKNMIPGRQLTIEP